MRDPKLGTGGGVGDIGQRIGLQNSHQRPILKLLVGVVIKYVMRFRKSKGLTDSEKILAQLCERSFLKLWTYPNLYKKKADELIDLMVVFRNDLLLFSDKSCSYPDTGDSMLDWRRWYRRAIFRSAHQIRRAEHWVRNYPEAIFLDAKALDPLPLTLPSPGKMNVHRICIATGAANVSIRDKGQPSLGIDMTVSDDAAPLCVGEVSNAGGFLHVFDASALELVLSELDTVSDFVRYLEAKQKLIGAGLFKRADAESDLLAWYLHHGRVFPEIDEIFRLEPNLWMQVSNNPAFQSGRRLNQIHRTWDRLIEHITEQFLREQLEFGNEISMDDYERIVRIMAGEGRFHRRILSEQIESRAERARDGWIGSILPSEDAEVIYVTLIGPVASRSKYKEYREHRSRELQLRCYAAKAARPAVRYIIGLGLDAAGQKGMSEDLVYLDTIEWTEDVMDRAQAVRNDLGYFVEGHMTEKNISVEEYPENDT